MGLCAACCHQEREPIRGSDAKKRTYPYVFDLERTFAESAGNDRHINLAELTEMWTAAARKASGKLTQEEVTLIEHAAKNIFLEMDVDGSGQVSQHEFVAHALGGTKTRGGLRKLRRDLQKELNKDPAKLKDLVERFKAWDKNRDGFITVDELEDHIDGLANGMHWLGNKDIHDARKLKEELLTVADVDGDGKVDMWEAIAWMLGRKKSPVELILYDISKGATAWAGPLLLGRRDVEAFHTALLVFGSEYWYGGKIFRTQPPCTKCFGPPMTSSRVLKVEPSEVMPEVPVVRLGYTFVTHAEFVEFVQTKCAERYTGLEKYDLLTHSCVHFTDECLHFLLGRPIPQHCMELQKMALTPTVKAIRPYLNKYLGGFSQEAGGGDQLLEDERLGSGTPAARGVNEFLRAGTIVLLDGGAAGIEEEGTQVVATIVAEKNDTMTVKFFDVETNTTTVKEGVRKAAVIKQVQ